MTNTRIPRKQFVPGYFMIKFNDRYGGSFAKRLKYMGFFGYMGFIAVSAWVSGTKPAKAVGNEKF